MKAWDDNFVIDTGTAHDGRVTTMALSLSFLCLLSTVLSSTLFVLVAYPNRSNFMKNMLMLFLICLCNERDVLTFHRFHFQFYNLLKKGDEKR